MAYTRICVAAALQPRNSVRGVIREQWSCALEARLGLAGLVTRSRLLGSRALFVGAEWPYAVQNRGERVHPSKLSWFRLMPRPKIDSFVTRILRVLSHEMIGGVF